MARESARRVPGDSPQDYTTAGLSEQAVAYWQRAVQRVSDRSAYLEAISHCTTGIELLKTLSETPEHTQQALSLYEHAEAAVALSTEQGFAQWVATGTILRGWALPRQGQGEAGIAQVRQGIAAYRSTGAMLNIPYFCTILADVAAHLGHTEDGIQTLAEGHTRVEQHASRCWEAEVWLQLALDVARRQEAKSLELRAAMSLARLWQQQGRRQAAYDLLAPLYSWFTEGFDTPDLQAAGALLHSVHPADI
jgi:predicted ATPase